MNASSRPQMVTDAMAFEPSAPGQLRLKCVACRHDMSTIDETDGSATARCASCRFTLSQREGIWRALAPHRRQRFRQFVHDYQEIRALEGRGAADSDFYLRLPYVDVTGHNGWQWKIRGRSFRFLETRILPELEDSQRQGLSVLDLGAGNCWMSYRLAVRGHKPVAVDLIDNSEDGLGAARHYLPHLPSPFVRFQAEMDWLPFDDRQFDLAIFNASFHYSEDYHTTVGEALRCLRRPGYLVIVDSPFYRRDDSGQQMVRERKAAFTRKFGFPSDSLASREYLTGEILEELGRAFHLSWQIAKPWYGLRWALRPVRAWLLRQREPSKFLIFWTKVADE